MPKPQTLYLKHCPFCSDMADLITTYDPTEYHGACMGAKCGAEGPRKETPAAAVQAWNTRFNVVSKRNQVTVRDILAALIGIVLVLGLCASSFAILPQAEPIEDRVDLMEVNHFYDEQGRKVFDQVIFYAWNPQRYSVECGFWDTTTEFRMVAPPCAKEYVREIAAPETVFVSNREEVWHGFDVVAWRLVKSPDQLPRPDRLHGGYVAVWHDNGLLRRVRSDAFRETWTQYDPELVEREFLPKDQRRGLGGER